MLTHLPIRTRLALLLLFVLITLTLMLVVLQQSQARQTRILFLERAAQTEAVFEKLVHLNRKGFEVHVYDYSRWDEFVDYVRRPNRTWAAYNIQESMPEFGLDVLWVLRPDLSVVFSAREGSGTPPESLPVPASELKTHLEGNAFLHFFTRTPTGVLETWTAPIQPTDDLERTTAPKGYYVIGRFLTPALLQELSEIANGRVSLIGGSPIERPSFSSRSGLIDVRQALQDLEGSPVAVLHLRSVYSAASTLQRVSRETVVILASSSMVLLLVVYLLLWVWILRPLGLLRDALRSEDSALLQGLPRRRDEFGAVAQLMAAFFEQQVGLVNEIGERLRQEEQLVEARDSAEAGARAKSQFLANISHELRTPMHGILSYARFGVREWESGERADLLDYFRNIHTAGESLLTLLNDLLDLSRLESGRMELESLPVDLEDVLQTAAVEFDSLMQERGIRLTVQVRSPLPAVAADRGKLLQVMRNLLSNAAKFTPNGSTIVADTDWDDRVVRVSVLDEGTGVPEAELETIFDKFVQSSRHHASAGGTGLGLAICREIVHAHGGRIWAENRDTGGARFSFEIPRADARETELGLELEAQEAPAA